MRIPSIGLALAGFIAMSSSAWADSFYDTVEQPDVQSTTLTLLNACLETFDSRPIGTQTFTTDFGTGGTFANVAVESANLYGGAGGTGHFASDYSGTYSLTFATPQTYVGIWISALNSTNYLTFSHDGTPIYSFAPAQLLAFVANDPAYFGNPTANFHNQDSNEPFAFVNFIDLTGSFNQIAVSGYGYEIDNITVGTPVSTVSNAVDFNVPEPLPIGLLGLGMIGLAFVRRPRQRAH